MSVFEVLVRGGADLGEGPVWNAGQLHWLDILRHEVHRFDPETGTDTLQRYDEPVAAMAPRDTGGTVATLGRRVVLLDQNGSVSGPPLAELPTGDRGNDGKCDPQGRYLVGTLTAAQHPGACALYRLDEPGRLTVVVPDVTLSNGLDWNPSGDLLYFVDTPTQRIDVFDYAADGSVGDRRLFVDLAAAPGRPDGLTVDAEGGVWVAMIRGGQLRRYDAAGQLDSVIELPVAKVTSCTFGGADLGDLFVTTASFQMSAIEHAAEPLAGALLRLRPGVAGKAAHTFDTQRTTSSTK